MSTLEVQHGTLHRRAVHAVLGQCAPSLSTVSFDIQSALQIEYAGIAFAEAHFSVFHDGARVHVLPVLGLDGQPPADQITYIVLVRLVVAGIHLHVHVYSSGLLPSLSSKRFAIGDGLAFGDSNRMHVPDARDDVSALPVVDVHQPLTLVHSADVTCDRRRNIDGARGCGPGWMIRILQDDPDPPG